ncbi:MAG: HEAT repeat domain-containing protein, partial [Clostridia bacterium]|nr:HEAT repeat domain-containing protein [Clostridia bacterium]
EKIATEVDAYVAAITNSSREGVLVVDKWFNPDSIKAELFDMYKNNNLEGAVFIGDIPIPMIRDAQHLTTAFKMDQKRRMDWSSVPSDRFYDDFDLSFDFIKQDENQKLFFYYSLRADSPQEITCDIYSARIKAPEGENKYKLVADYLVKAAEAHKNCEAMDKVLHFAGHGYNSDSMNARIDEAIALTEHFQFLNNNIAKLDYIDFTFDNSVKNRLMGALADNTLDLAILHHHGGDDAQYLNGAAQYNDPQGWIKLVKNYLRGKVRDAKNQAETKLRFKKSFDVPMSWMDDANTPERILEDSLYAAGKDIMIPDFKGYSSNAKMIIIDACFNGSFCNDDYLACHYLFNPGNTIVVKANSVNTLQDTWTTELIGLLNWGACAGNWAKGQLTLESHLYGDPTFAFAAQNTEAVGKNVDVNAIMFDKKNDMNYWKGILKNSAADELMCDMKSLAIQILQRNNAISSQELLDIQKNSNSRIVRLAAFNANRKIADANLPKAIMMGVDDTYELLQRLAAQYSGKNNSNDVIPTLANALMDPTTPGRIIFQVQGNTAGFDGEMFLNELKKINE